MVNTCRTCGKVNGETLARANVKGLEGARGQTALVAAVEENERMGDARIEGRDGPLEG